jgi:DNA-binding protein WhiA
MGGTLLIRGSGVPGLSFSTENAAVARKALTMIRQEFSVAAEVVVTRARRLQKRNTYKIRIIPSPAVAELLTSLGILAADGWAGDDSALLRKPCCRRAYLRGAFLGGGSVNKPEGDYHLELVTANEIFAKTLYKLLRAQHLPAGMTERKHDSVVYLKDGDAISGFLGLVGAYQAVMKFENVRVVKDMRNQVNRLVNCETANLQKTVNAAGRQLDAIRLINRAIGIDNLPNALRETAKLRLEFPEASLQELVDASCGKLGKSGINHRLRKLEAIAAEYKAGDNSET